MSVAEIQMPAKLVPVFDGPAYVRGAFGGRGSGKTRTFALMTAVRAMMWDNEGRSGIILCGRQFMNSLADSSMDEVKEAIRSHEWLLQHFDIGENYIRTKSGRISYAFVGLSRNLNSIKSKSRILLAWIDEAEPVTDDAWVKLIPTLREEDSELWITWNPERAKSSTNQRFRIANDNNPDPLVKIVEINWRDNPWFPAILDRARLKDQRERPDQYEHIWEGAYISSVEGAYYSKFLTIARQERRIGRLAPDPLMRFCAVFDIGGTGQRADATAIWIVQYIAHEILLLDYYEAVGQPLSAHVNWLRDNGYAKALCVLPHDGASHEKVFKTTYEGALNEAGFDCIVIPNQGAGAALRRIEAARRLFSMMYFNEEKCSGGIEAIGWYHEKRDPERGIGLGPNHDWSSHGADAFGLIAVARSYLLNINDNDDYNDDWSDQGRNSSTGY